MKKFFSLLFQTTIILMMVLFLFEMSYRFSIIDFYKAELSILNNADDIQSEGVDYLVFGDSFSASGNNYVDVLRQSSDKIFVNSGVQGIGVKQVNTFVNRRLEKYQPKNVIYQVYVGNDLTDINHLTNYKELSFIRNLYWDVSDILLSCSYINYRLGYFKSTFQQIDRDFNEEEFSITDYNYRSKLYFKSDSEYLQKSVMIEGDFEKRYSIWIKEVIDFVEVFSEDVKIHIVFIPHCAQLNSFYFDNLNKIGGTFEDEEQFNKTNYSFFEKASLDLKSYNNVTLLNPLKQLREKDTQEQRLYYLNDPHLNDTGQEVLGIYLKKIILAQ